MLRGSKDANHFCVNIVAPLFASGMNRALAGCSTISYFVFLHVLFNDSLRLSKLCASRATTHRVIRNDNRL